MSEHVTSTSAGMLPATDLDGIRRQIHEFIQMYFLFGGAPADLEDAASLVEQGVVDDTGVLEIVLFIEDGWGLTVDPQDLSPEHFDSVNALAEYVHQHLANT
jgi:acyl carrier protein